MDKSKASVRVNGVSFMVEINRSKTEKEFVDEQKHNFDNDEAKTKETYRLFKDAIKPAANAPETK